MREIVVLSHLSESYSFAKGNKIPSGFIARRLKYEPIVSSTSYTRTQFYEGDTIKVHRKYIFFGPKIQTKEPKKIFEIAFDCDDPKLTAEFWQEQIIKELKIYDRKVHLASGNLIIEETKVKNHGNKNT